MLADMIGELLVSYPIGVFIGSAIGLGAFLIWTRGEPPVIRMATQQQRREPEDKK